MRMTRRLLPCLSRAVLALMLLTQFALAAQACTMAGSVPAMAFGEQPCDSNANACLADCTKENQSASHAELPVFVLPQLAVLTLPELPARKAEATRTDNSAVFSSDPPIPIRFCSFLT